MSDHPAYVVRGALMECEMGSHHRRINLPESHGSYVNDKPMMNEEDCKPNHIPYFGICKSVHNLNSEVVHLIAEDGSGTISGKPCVPIFYGKWMNAKEGTLVEGKAALTTDSVIFCDCKGVVTILKDGQHDD